MVLFSLATPPSPTQILAEGGIATALLVALVWAILKWLEGRAESALLRSLAVTAVGVGTVAGVACGPFEMPEHWLPHWESFLIQYAIHRGVIGGLLGGFFATCVLWAITRQKSGKRRRSDCEFRKPLNAENPYASPQHE